MRRREAGNRRGFPPRHGSRSLAPSPSLALFLTHPLNPAPSPLDRNHRPRRPRQVHGRQGYLGRADGPLQERAREEHHHQAGVRQRQDLQGRRPELPAAEVLQGLRVLEGGLPRVRRARVRGHQDGAAEARVVCRLPWCVAGILLLFFFLFIFFGRGVAAAVVGRASKRKIN